MKTLTPCQQETLSFIEDHIASKGRAPTFREMGAVLGGISSKAISDRLGSLKRKGYIDWKPHGPRSIRVLPRIHEIACAVPEHGIEAGDYVHVENGRVTAITRRL